MDSLPDDSLVVSVAGQVKFMSGRELRYSCNMYHNLIIHSNTEILYVVRYRVNCALILRNAVISFDKRRTSGI